MSKTATINFTRSESWKDYLGKHSGCNIMRGKEKIGTIEGDSGCGIPMMQYTVKIGETVVGSSYSLQGAKQLARERVVQ